MEFDTDSSCIAVAIVSQELTAQMTIHSNIFKVDMIFLQFNTSILKSLQTASAQNKF